MTPSLLSVYLRFLRSPDLITPATPPPARRVISQSLRLYCLHLMLVLGAAILIHQVTGEDDNLVTDRLNELSLETVFFLAVVIAPVLEELVFRLPLRGSVFNIGLAFILSVMFGLMPGEIVGFVAVVGGIILLLVGIARFYAWFPQIIFYSLSLSFGAMHITNYEAQVWHWLPLLVLPQFLVGLWCGFVRVNYGFGWAVLAHAFHNGCFLLPTLAIRGFGSPQLISEQLMSELAAPDAVPWLWQDWVVMVGIGFYMLGGLLICAVQSWRLLRELLQDWQKKTTS